MDVLQLRSQVEAALGDSIGTYTFKNGQVTKAIAVVKAYDIFPPEGTKISGLEALIFYPTPITQIMLNSYQVEREWVIHLKQWDRGASIYPAADKIYSLDANIKQTIFISPNERLGVPAGLSVKFFDFILTGG